jgi:hypothetical protein
MAATSNFGPTGNGQLANVGSGTVTGVLPPANGGTGINNGTNALTVPATGTAALLGTANVFTAAQTLREGTKDLLSFNFASSTSAGIHGVSGGMAFVSNNVDIAQINDSSAGYGGFQMNAAYPIVWSSSAIGGSSDSGIARVAAAVVKACDGTQAGAGWFQNTAGRARVSTQFDKTNSSTLGNVTGLTVNVTAGRTYSFSAVLFVDADAAGGHKYAIAGTATATAIIHQVDSVSNTSNLNVINSRLTSLGGSAGQAGATAVRTEIKGTITVNAGGTLTVQFAQNVATPATTSSVLVGSYMMVEDMP